jgi:hypothetical protein
MLQVALLPFQHLTPLSGTVLSDPAPRVIVPEALGCAVNVVVGVPAAIEKLPVDGVHVTPPPVALSVPVRFAFNSLPAGQGTVLDMHPFTVTGKEHRLLPAVYCSSTWSYDGTEGEPITRSYENV